MPNQPGDSTHMWKRKKEGGVQFSTWDASVVGVSSSSNLRGDGKMHWPTTAELRQLVLISCIMQITFVYGRSNAPEHIRHSAELSRGQLHQGNGYIEKGLYA